MTARTARRRITPAVYTGLADGTIVDAAGNGHDYIYAANEGTSPGIQVFDSSFGLVQLPNGNVKGNPNFTGNFTLPAGTLPAGFMPYGVRDLSLVLALNWTQICS